jgi:CDGSH-type Zn-finger protein
VNDRDLRITVTKDGPYRLDGPTPLRDATGAEVTGSDTVFLCRCGQPQSKPFCDGSHARVGFDGTEAASRDRIEDRRDAYEGDGVTIYDDRLRCAHAGFCTDGLPDVFKLAQEPWIEPKGAGPPAAAAVVSRCPSGAIAYALPPAGDPEEAAADPRVSAVPDGPYRVAGGVPVVAADGTPYEVRARQTLCRCRQSRTSRSVTAPIGTRGFATRRHDRLSQGRD